jgi:asparaginyl-tRNA synthetase
MDLEGDMELAEGLIQKIVQDVLTYKLTELKKLERNFTVLEHIASQAAFPRISYSEAVEILQKNGVDFKWGDDFGGADETVISSQFDLPVIVYGYPKEIKPFYMKQDPNDSKIVRNMDVLAPEGYGEIIGGGERESDLALLEAALATQGLDSKDYEWYLDLRRYGAVPHAGFGLGVERALAWICSLPHVRETGAFPRLPRRLRP